MADLRPVEADQRMEMHRTAELVLGDLGVLKARHRTEVGGSTPKWWASIRRKVVVNRRHSSGAHHCHTTAEA